MFMHLRFSSTLTIGAAVLWSAAAHAADNTRYISISGKNTNPCTLALPCRTLQFAIGIVPAGGEVQILDSGFYGNNANIKKSLTITGNGHTVYLGAVLTIDKVDAVVALRGLTLDGQSAIADGIRITTAAAVHIERCLVHGFTERGIRAGSGEVFVVDTTLRENGLFGFQGAGASRVTIDNSHFHHNGSTGVVTGSANTTIHRSTASGNASFGIFVTGGSTASVASTAVVQNGSAGFVVVDGSTMMADFSVAHGNGGQGLSVSNGGIARISNSTFTDNVTGVQNSSSTIATRGNNTIEGNTTDVSGTLTLINGK